MNLILPPNASAPANDVKYKWCPYCGAPNKPGLQAYTPKLITGDDPDQSAIICTNPTCGAAAPPHTWNNRYNPIALVVK